MAGVNRGRRSPSGGTRTTARRIGAWLFSVVVLVAVVLLEVAFFRDDIVTDVNLLLDAGRSGSAPSAARSRTACRVPPAPAAAGAVSGVDLRTLDRVRRARPAPSVPGVARPGTRSADRTWSFRVVDRCTGATDTTPGGSVTVPPGAEQAKAVGTSRCRRTRPWRWSPRRTCRRPRQPHPCWSARASPSDRPGEPREGGGMPITGSGGPPTVPTASGDGGRASSAGTFAAGRSTCSPSWPRWRWSGWDWRTCTSPAP